MPSEKSIFTPLSILFRPHQQQPYIRLFLVEAPGTEPYTKKNGLVDKKIRCP